VIFGVGTDIVAVARLGALYARGKPEFRYEPALEAYMASNGLRAHLSLSDERDYAVAFVVVEKL